MFDQLLDLVKKHAGDAIVNNPDIPNEKNEAAIHEASSSISKGLQGLLSQGGLKELLKMFGGQGNANAAVTNAISGSFIQNLIGKFGLDDKQAGKVADKVVPGVLDDLVSKTNDPNDNSFDIQGIFNNLSGGKTAGFDLQGILSKLRGGKLDLDGDGDSDLQDLIALFKNGQTGGGLLDKVKGLFGR